MSVPRLSELQRTILNFRQQLLALDDKALELLQRSWITPRNTLTDLISGLVQEIEAQPIAHPPDVLRLTRARVLLEQLEAESTRIAKIANQVIPEAQRIAVQQAITSARAITTAQAGSTQAAAAITAEWTAINTGAVSDLVGALQDGSPITEWLQQSVPKQVDAVRDVLIDGVTRGINANDLGRRIAAATELPLRSALTLARTETMRAYRSASFQSMQENATLLAGYERSASLSPTTCAGCLATSGQFYPLSVPFTEHPRGRCVPIPVLRDPDGLMPHIETGREWFERQPVQTQQQILGPGAFDAYSRGEIQFEDMATTEHSPVWGGSTRRATLDEARANARKRRAGTLPRGVGIAAGGR